MRLFLSTAIFLGGLNIGMAQQLEFNKKGVTNFQIGDSIHLIKDLKPLSVHPHKNTLRPWFEDEYKYYFLDKKVIRVAGVAIKYFFVVANQADKIISLIAYANDSTETIKEKLSNIFGKPAVKSESSIEGWHSNSKTFWNTPSGIIVFFTKYPHSSLSKIDICKAEVDERMPGISVYFE